MSAPRHVVRARLRRAADAVVCVVIALVALAPILWGISTSLKRPERILAYPPELIPSEPTLQHYRTLFAGGIGWFVANSVVVSALTVGACVVLGALAGYALARFSFAGRAVVLVTIVAVMSIPLPSLLVPTYSFLANLGLINTRVGLVLLYTAYQLPLTIWILMGFFRTIPPELEQAAMIDGYSRLQALRRVLLPLSRTGLIAAGLLVLTFAWNDFVVALVITSSEEVRTLPVSIYFYLGFFGRDWGPLTAGAMVSIVPVIAVFVLFQRYFLSGMTGGSVKG